MLKLIVIWLMHVNAGYMLVIWWSIMVVNAGYMLVIWWLMVVNGEIDRG